MAVTVVKAPTTKEVTITAAYLTDDLQIEGASRIAWRWPDASGVLREQIRGGDQLELSQDADAQDSIVLGGRGTFVLLNAKLDAAGTKVVKLEIT